MEHNTIYRKRGFAFLLFLAVMVTALPLNSVYAAVQLDSQTIANYVNGRVGNKYPNGYCLKFVEESYQNLGANRPYHCCAYKSGSTYIVSTGRDNIPIGATVYFGNCGGGPCKSCGASYYGHVGIYTGNGYFVHATGGSVQKSTISSWSNKYRGWGYCGGFSLKNSEQKPVPVTHNPEGCLDSAEGGSGKVRVSGWAFDEDNYGAQLEIHVYLGDASGPKKGIGKIKADKERTDVGAYRPGAGNYHGFNDWIEVAETGKYIVYVYAIDVGGGSNVLLGTREVNISSRPQMGNTALHTWISDSKMGDVPDSFKFGGTYYLCYELLDADSGRRYEAPDGVSYQMKETLYAPDGSVATTCTYSNSSHNWIAVQAEQIGRYRGMVEISGDANYQGNEMSFTIPKVSALQMGAWMADSPMGEEVNTYKQGNYCYICYELIDKETRKRWGELCAGNYTMEILVYRPDGSVLDSDIFHDDHGYFTCQVEEEGIYQCVINVSGTYITGTVQWKDSFEVLPQTELGFYYGDLDHNGKVTATDLSAINQAANGLISLSDDDKKRADLDGDGRITANDVELLREFMVGNINEFPIEKMLTGIVITRCPDKTSYYKGDPLSMTGMKVEAVYGNFTVKEITDYKFSGNTENAGEQEVTVSYTEGGITKTAVQKVNVTEKHVHNYQDKVTKEPTCTAEGERTYTCSCGRSYTEQIEKRQHTEVIDAALEASCTQAGKTQGSHCSVCGLVIKFQTEIPAAGHTSILKNVEAADCSKTGYTGDTYCKNCGEKLSEGSVIEKTGHTWDDGKITKQPSASQPGVKTYLCSICGITRTEIIPATGEQQGHIHTYQAKVTKEPACTAEGERTYTCSCGHSYTEKIEKKRHTKVIDAAQEASCTQQGCTQGSHCSVCGTVIEVQSVIPKTDHQKTVVRDAREADCTRKGYTGDTYCQDCGKKLSSGSETAQKAHVWNSGTVIKQAAERQTGIRSFTCQLCGRTKQEMIPASGAGQHPGGSTLPGKTWKTGDIIYDKMRAAKYKVIQAAPNNIEVEYVKPVDKKASIITIPDMIETPDGRNCRVTAISEGAFCNHKYLKKVVIGDNVQTIGKKAFYGCSRLISLQMGKKVSRIESNALKKCSSLSKLILPAKVSKIGANVFHGCKKLKTLQIKSTRFSSSSLEKKAFAGVPSKCAVQVPGNRLKKYKKLFRQKGLPAKIKISRLP